MPIADHIKQLTSKRLRILWIVLGALLLVSVTPLWLYHRQVIGMSEQKLQDTERVQQSEITRSLASETLEFEQNLSEQLLSQRQVLALTGWITDVDDAAHAPQLARLLQSFVENNQNILYVTAVNKQARGQSAGSFRADSDPFVQVALKHAFTASIQGLNFVSEPFALGEGSRPALIVSVPLSSSGLEAGRASESFAAQAMSALRAFDPLPDAAGFLAKEQAREPNLAAPVLPNLPLEGLKLAGVRAMPGDQGQKLCLFYTRQDAGTLALCVEKTPGPSDSVARPSGNFPSAAISWRQKGADYALAGALPDQELRVLADAVRAQVEAFDGK